MGCDFVGDIFYLLFIVFCVIVLHCLTALFLGEQFLFDPVVVLFDKRVRDRQNRLCAAVIFAHDNVVASEAVLVFKAFVVQPSLKVHKHAHIGTAPFVYVLIRIPHHKQIPVALGKAAYQLEFLRSDVLELVHHDIMQAVLPFSKNIGVSPKQIYGEIYQVEEVKSIILPLLFYVAEHDFIRFFPGDQRRIIEVRVGEVFHIGDPVFVIPDLVYHELEAGGIHFYVHLIVDFFQYLLLVDVIEDNEVFGVKQL